MFHRLFFVKSLEGKVFAQFFLDSQITHFVPGEIM
jgi:hypothetical protein